MSDIPSAGTDSDETLKKAVWQTRLIGSRLPWHATPLPPAEIAEGLCAVLLARENALEDARYNKIVPNRFVVELNPGVYVHNYQPLESQILDQWRERLLEHLLTANRRQGRTEYRFGGPVQIELRTATDLRNSQARLLSRVQPDRPSVSGAETATLPACLETLDGGRRWQLREGRLTIGRDSSCEVFLDLPEVQGKKLVSSRHATLYCQAGSYRLVDGTPEGSPSLNGTFVNLQPIGRGGMALRDGDLILLAALHPAHPSPDTPGVAALRFRLECL